MVTPSDPIPTIRSVVLAAAPELTEVVIGPAIGSIAPPFATVRNVGGPEEEAQVPQAQRRIDVNVFAKDTKEANRIMNLIHRAIRQRRNQAGALDFPNIFSAGGPLDLVDDDRRLPFVFRPYYVIFGES